ncbi:hypothetical protein SAMN04490244_101262 [Tranquillimonas rosea]|uniref:Uncharacterized protein n=1 Tax=Tranquillimonas rosea TaxID=641238 RepID=A0A1H9PMY1_9RHOB|nr:hypothetical protein [Tranquillimonas rosea]SER49621.1 hypothetical protein SAMN04490244_101262 [Tranquillimonas rosea]
MAKVIAWPPVGLTAWELTRHHPIGRSRSYFGKPSRVSGAGAPRYLATATVTGIGADMASAGYIEMLKDQLGFGSQLVRVPSMAPLWHLHARGRNLVNQLLNWRASGDELLWTAESADMSWSANLEMYGTPTTDDGWPLVQVQGLPAGAVVRPSEFIVMRDGEGEETRRILTVARADAYGWATIRLDEAFSFGGLVSVGERRDVVFQALNRPRAIQPVSGSWSFEWQFREVFEHEYPGGFTHVDPWR